MSTELETLERAGLGAVATPVQFELDGATVTIYEVLPVEPVPNQRLYLVVLRLEYRGYKTLRYSILVRDWRELKAKLLVEISKLKWLTLLPQAREVLLR